VAFDRTPGALARADPADSSVTQGLTPFHVFDDRRPNQSLQERTHMDFQGQRLAHTEYTLSNELARKAGRTELLDPRERRFRLPKIPNLAIWRVAWNAHAPELQALLNNSLRRPTSISGATRQK
jgi:hypothetical protein